MRERAERPRERDYPPDTLRHVQRTSARSMPSGVERRQDIVKYRNWNGARDDLGAVRVEMQISCR